MYLILNKPLMIYATFLRKAFFLTPYRNLKVIMIEIIILHIWLIK